MKRKSKRVRVMRLWDWKEAKGAIPYLRSILASLREHWLDARSAQITLDRHISDSSPRSTQKLLREKACQDELSRSQDKFDTALEELAQIDAYLLDPVNGVALMPFRMKDDLAWYYIDLFEPEVFAGWRFHDDPLDVCRPIELVQDLSSEKVLEKSAM